MTARITAVAAAALAAVAGLAHAQPACTGSQELFAIASDASTDQYFGWDVDIEGDWAIVGAPRNDNVGGANAGAAYILRRVGGSWQEQAKLLATDGSSSNQFGISVAISGNRVAVGALSGDISGTNNVGAVYIFERNTSTNVWTQTNKLNASDAAASDEFGASVDLQGNNLIVGSPNDDDRGSNSGSVYIFRRTGGTTWNQLPKIVATDGQANDQFGIDVALDGTTYVIGAYLDDDRGGDSGSAYVYTELTPGSFFQQGPKLTASDGVSSDHFGRKVDISGERLIVGARLNDDRGTDSGSAYIFQRFGGAVWVEETKLIGSDTGSADEFGIAVAISGDTAVVGARFDDDRGGESGSAYFFERETSSSVWSQTGKFAAPALTGTDEFGFDLAYDGTRIISGGYLNDTFNPLTVSTNNGAISIFALACGGGSSCLADVDGNGQLSFNDVQTFILSFNAGCP